MKKIISIGIILLISTSIYAQGGYESVLNQIETNSSTLNAFRKQIEANKLENKTGIYLSNPEVEFNYLWGSPSTINNRTDFSIKQSFDFPTVYSYKSKISNLQNSNLDLEFKAERINLLLKAKKICIELAYNNALSNEIEMKLKNAEMISQAYQRKFEKGDANAIEVNKTKIYLISIQNDLKKIDSEREILSAELVQMNGGNEINYSQIIFSNPKLPDNFESWYSQAELKSVVLQYLKQQVEINEKKVKLNKALTLPKFSLGYMSEIVVGNTFQGISVGFTIPLWENKNIVRQAKSQVLASTAYLFDSKQQYYNRLRGLFYKAQKLQTSTTEYKNAFISFNNDKLLKRALDAGELSLLNYLIEIDYYYDAKSKALEAERDFELAYSELTAVLL